MEKEKTAQIHGPDAKDIKEQIISFCQQQDGDLAGFVPVARWDQAGEVPPAFRPGSLWSPARIVIVIGLSMPLPVVETTPSILHEELYITCNRELDSLAFNLVRFLNRQGIASYFFTRDGFGSIKMLKKKSVSDRQRSSSLSRKRVRNKIFARSSNSGRQS